MKSALELAMEKTEKLLSKQSAGLSDAQKKRIAEIEAECRAKVAELFAVDLELEIGIW